MAPDQDLRTFAWLYCLQIQFSGSCKCRDAKKKTMCAEPMRRAVLAQDAIAASKQAAK